MDSDPAVAESDEEDALYAPELARIRAAARTGSIPPGEGSNNAPGGQDDVQIRVRWIPHPEDANGQAETWSYRLRRVSQRMW